MHCVLLIGLQGSGKSAFFKQTFADTHVRINRDMLKTKPREQKLFTCCLQLRQPCVIDNTNATRDERSRFIAPAKAAGFAVSGYFLEVPVADAVARNASRPEGQRIPVVGIYATAKRMQIPEWTEGFDAIYRVTLIDGTFVIADWPKRPDPR